MEEWDSSPSPIIQTKTRFSFSSEDVEQSLFDDYIGKPTITADDNNQVIRPIKPKQSNYSFKKDVSLNSSDKCAAICLTQSSTSSKEQVYPASSINKLSSSSAPKPGTITLTAAAIASHQKLPSPPPHKKQSPKKHLKNSPSDDLYSTKSKLSSSGDKTRSSVNTSCVTTPSYCNNNINTSSSAISTATPSLGGAGITVDQILKHPVLRVSCYK